MLNLPYGKKEKEVPQLPQQKAIEHG